jgi:CubicO group peptidase (beta-lactamase class C family)
MRNIYLIGFFIPFSLQAQTWSDSSDMIDKVMSSRYAKDMPGCQLSISRNGKVIYSKAFGMADMEHHIPMTLDAITEAGSVSKQFTAAAVLLLQQQGKLSVQDDIHKYFPELPEYGDAIRIAHLLHHTSGLRDWGAVAGITGWPRSTKAYSNDDVLDIITHQRHLNFRPGAEYGYSNSNFNLLAILVQRVSGQSLADFTRQHIFIPAGMTHTQWRDDHNRIVADRAIAYDMTKESIVMDMPGEDAYGNGGLLTTTEDLLKWQEFYLSGNLGGKSLLDDQLHVEKLNNGVVNPYAAGLMLTFDGNGLTDVNHSGSTAGYRANLEHVVDKDLTIAWLANSSLMDTVKLKPAAAVRNLFIPKPQMNAIPEGGYTPTVAEMSVQQGWYRNDRTGAGMLVRQDGVRMMLDRTSALSPLARGRYLEGGSIYLFNDQGLSVIKGWDTITYTRAFASDAINAASYQGAYRSTETGSTLSVTLRDGRPYLVVKPGLTLSMAATYMDGFDLPDWKGNAYFSRNKKGQVESLYISVDRARKVEFTRNH